MASAAATKSIALITMSTRTPRVGPHVTSLLHEILSPLAATSSIDLSQVDLASFNLPLFNEPFVPGLIGTPGGPTSFTLEPSRAWSDEIKKHDGYVLVIPEYNYSVAGATKNAVDFLLHEWKGKPAAVISYGIKGAGLANEQLRGILGQMGLKVVKTKVELSFSSKGRDEKTGAGGDLFPAMLKGELGDETKKEWLASEKRKVVEEAWGELVGLLNEEGEEVKN